MPDNPLVKYLGQARRHNTFTVAQLRDINGLVTAVATATSTQTYTTSSLDGVLANPGPSVHRAPMLVSVTTSASVGSYNLVAITVTGTDETGAALVDTITLTAANGSEYLQTTSALWAVESIVVPPMVDASGQFEFGVHDLVFSNDNPCRQVRHGSAGNIQVAFVGGTTGPYIDTTPGIEGERHDSLILRVYGDAAVTTSDPVTVYV